MIKLSVEFYAYLAGFIDADGSIFLTGNNRKKKGAKSGISVWVYVFQKDPKILEWFQDSTEYGTIQRRTSSSPLSSPGFTYAWLVHKASEVRALLPHLIPYLQLKRGQAKIVLEGSRLIGSQGHKPSQEDKKKRRGLLRKWEERQW